MGFLGQKFVGAIHRHRPAQKKERVRFTSERAMPGAGEPWKGAVGLEMKVLKRVAVLCYNRLDPVCALAGDMRKDQDFHIHRASGVKVAEAFNRYVMLTGKRVRN